MIPNPDTLTSWNSQLYMPLQIHKPKILRNGQLVMAQIWNAFAEKKFMVRGAKEELLRSNTPKVTKLEGKKGGAAPEQRAAFCKNGKKWWHSQQHLQMIFHWVSVCRVNFFRITQQNATWCKCKSSTRYALIWSSETPRKWDSDLIDSISGNFCAFSTKFTVD